MNIFEKLAEDILEKRALTAGIIIDAMSNRIAKSLKTGRKLMATNDFISKLPISPGTEAHRVFTKAIRNTQTVFPGGANYAAKLVEANRPGSSLRARHLEEIFARLSSPRSVMDAVTFLN